MSPAPWTVHFAQREAAACVWFPPGELTDGYAGHAIIDCAWLFLMISVAPLLKAVPMHSAIISHHRVHENPAKTPRSVRISAIRSRIGGGRFSAQTCSA